MIVKKRAGSFIERSIDGELLLLNAETGILYSLKDVGLFVWKLLDSESDFDAIRERVLSQYDVDRATGESEVMEFLNEMHHANFLVRH